jgi:hypothetical protein
VADVDLRPMTLGEVLDRTFTLYKKHFWLFVGIMSLPLLLLLAFQVGAVLLGIGAVEVGKNVPLGPGAAAGVLTAAIAGVIIFVILYLVMFGAAEAATVFAVSDLYLGRVATIRGSFAKVRGRILRALGVILLTGLIVFVGLIALIIPGVILLCRTSVSVPVSMLEDESPSAAISRSMELTKGFGWSMFLILFLVWTLSIVATIMFQYPLMFLALMSAANRHSTPIYLLVLQDLSSFVSSALVGPVGTIALSLMYYNLRVRKEAFDLQHLMSSLNSGSGPMMDTPAAPTAI